MTETEAPHTDDIAVDRFVIAMTERFAIAMKTKLAKKRKQGFGGWDNPEECSIAHLSRLLINHVAKSDPVDVANLAMMIHQRGGTIAAPALLPEEPDGWIWEDEFTCEREVRDTWIEAGREPSAFYFSPPAAPAPQPVAVKALEWQRVVGDVEVAGSYKIDRMRPLLSGKPKKYWVQIALGFGFQTVASLCATPDDAKAAAQADYETRIRSALSDPVGGMEESGIIKSDNFLWSLSEDEQIRLLQVLAKNIGRDKAYQALNQIALPWQSFQPLEVSLTPASDIAALREENVALRQIISDCATSLTNGAYIAAECSVDFMKGLPKEIELVIAALSQEKSGP